MVGRCNGGRELLSADAPSHVEDVHAKRGNVAITLVQRKSEAREGNLLQAKNYKRHNKIVGFIRLRKFKNIKIYNLRKTLQWLYR